MIVKIVILAMIGNILHVLPRYKTFINTVIVSAEHVVARPTVTTFSRHYHNRIAFVSTSTSLGVFRSKHNNNSNNNKISLQPHPSNFSYRKSISRCNSSSSDIPTDLGNTNKSNESKNNDSTFSNYITATSKENNNFHNQVDQESNSINYPKGIPEGFYIVQHYSIPDRCTLDTMLENAIEQSKLNNNSDEKIGNDEKGVGITQEELDRLGITNGENMTLPIALMLLDPKEYPSFSKARKACRKGYIIIHRGPLNNNNIVNDFDDDDSIRDMDPSNHDDNINEDIDDSNNGISFDLKKCIRGRVGDRVYPHDVIGRQVRMHGGFYPGLECNKPPFDLPVVYEDDHFAIVNKPAGIVVYSQKNQGHGMMTIRSALPFALKPPKRGTLSIIRRPVSVHRLDKPTAGLLLIAKTKPAMIDLTKQFVERRIKKTYTAIVNGIPDEPSETSLSNLEAHNMGVDVDYSSEDSHREKWQLIDSSLDDGNSVKSAVTIWKPLQYVKSLKAKDGILTKVELKPKTGRYHQLRRHMVSTWYLLFQCMKVWFSLLISHNS